MTHPSRLSCLNRSPCPPWIDISERIKVDFHINTKDLNEREVQLRFQEILQGDYCNYTAIFTDGSKTDDHTAAAYVIPDYSIEYYVALNKSASVLTAEMIAIQRALEYCIRDPNRKYVIFSDSLSACLLYTSDAADE